MSAEGEVKYKLNTASPFEFHERKRQMVFEYQIAVEQKAIIRDQLAECARTENVNQFRNCRELREKYLALQRDRYHGMLFPEDLQPTNRDLPGVVVPK